MPHSLSTDELVRTIVDQAHQNRRLNDQNVELSEANTQLQLRIGALTQELEAAKVARDVIEAAPKEAK